LTPALFKETDGKQPGNYQVKQDMNARVRHADLVAGRSFDLIITS
jgi:hypothetical protein